MNEPVPTAIQCTAAPSFHGTADPDIKHVPPLSCSETASVATAPHSIPPPSNYHRLARGPFPPTDHQLPQSCWRGLSVATKKIAAVVHTQLHRVLPLADSVHTDLSEVVSLLKSTGLVEDLSGGVGGREGPCGGEVVCRREWREDHLSGGRYGSRRRGRRLAKLKSYFFSVVCLMALLASTVSVGPRVFCLQRVGFESVQVSRPQPGASTVVLRPILQ